MAPSRGSAKPKRLSEKSTGQRRAPLGAKSAEHSEHNSVGKIPVHLQQKIINVFRNAFQHILDSDINNTLQEVKTHLYNRDFSQAFSRKDYLEAYAVRWSPSRALCYAEIFYDVLRQHKQACQSGNLTVASLGGGAGAELVSLVGIRRRLDDVATLSTGSSPNDEASSRSRLCIRVTDIADWSDTVSALQTALTTTPPISTYASETAKAANGPLVQDTVFNADFRQADLLKIGESHLRELVSDAGLITLMFTLNELYSASLSATQVFLEALTSVAQNGALLLVVDSPGSYSTITLNGKEKQYPMHWLVDHTLLEQEDSHKDSSVGSLRWEKLRTEESKWFRLPEGLLYPIQLENMRYQLHLYRRNGNT